MVELARLIIFVSLCMCVLTDSGRFRDIIRVRRCWKALVIVTCFDPYSGADEIEAFLSTMIPSSPRSNSQNNRLSQTSPAIDLLQRNIPNLNALIGPLIEELHTSHLLRDLLGQDVGGDGALDLDFIVVFGHLCC